MCDLTIYATACHLDRSAAKWRDPCNAVAPEIGPGSSPDNQRPRYNAFSRANIARYAERQTTFTICYRPTTIRPNYSDSTFFQTLQPTSALTFSYRRRNYPCRSRSEF